MFVAYTTSRGDVNSLYNRWWSRGGGGVHYVRSWLL